MSARPKSRRLQTNPPELDTNTSDPPVPQGLTHQAIAGVSWSALSNLARQVISFFAIAVLARVLGPGVYGLMGMASLVLIFLANFRHLGTATAIIQRPHVSERLLSSLFWVNCMLGALLFGLTFAGAGLISDFFHEPMLTPVMRVISTSFLIASAGTVPSSLLARRMQFDKLAIADFGSVVIGYSLSIPLALLGFGIWSLIIANLVNTATGTLGYCIFARWRPIWVFDRHEIRSVAAFSLNLAGFGFVNYFSRNADNIIVGRYAGSVALGYYQFAYQLFMLPLSNISSVIGQVLNPAFARIQDDNPRFRLAYVRSSMLIALLAFPVIAGIAVVADPLIRTVLGAKWLPAISLVQVLAPVGVFQSVLGSVGQIYVAKGRTDWMFRFGVFAAVVFVTAFLIGVRWGALGVAVAYVISYLGLVAYPSMAISFRLIDLSVSEYLKKLAPEAGVTVLMAGVAWAWLSLVRALGATPLIQLVSTSLVGAVVYIIALLLFGSSVLAYVEEILSQSNRPLTRSMLKILWWRRA